MNDFTKEELESISDSLDSEMSTFRRADNEFMRGLHLKVQSMIDNYCEHEWALVLSADEGRFIKCQKCERRL